MLTSSQKSRVVFWKHRCDNELGFGLLRISAEEYSYDSYDSNQHSLRERGNENEKQSEKTRVIVNGFNAR